MTRSASNFCASDTGAANADMRHARRTETTAALIFGSLPVSFLFVAARAEKASRAGAKGIQKRRGRGVFRDREYALDPARTDNTPNDRIINTKSPSALPRGTAADAPRVVNYKALESIDIPPSQA